MESRLDQMQQQQIDAFEHLDQQRQLESVDTKACFKLILDRLNVNTAAAAAERNSSARRSADLEEPILDEIQINLQQSNQPKSAATTPPNNSLTDEQFYSTLSIENKNKNIENKNKYNRRQSTDLANPDYIVNPTPITTTRQRPPVDFSLTKITVYNVVK